MNCFVKIAEGIKKISAKQFFAAVLKVVLVAVLPFCLCRGLSDYFIKTDLEEKQEQEFLEIKRILSRISAQSEVLKRFDAAFSSLAALPFPSHSFNKRLEQIYTEANGAIEFFVLDAKLKSVEFYFTKRSPKSFVEKKFIEATLSPSLSDKNSGFIKGVSGYKSTAKKLNGSPNRIIKIGNTQDKQWGGWFRLKDKNSLPSGHLVVLIKKSKIKAEELLDNAVASAIRLHGRSYKICWRSATDLSTLRPSGHTFDSEALPAVDRMPIGEERFFYKGKSGLKMVSDSGSTILAMAIRPIEPEPMFKAINFSVWLVFAAAIIISGLVFLSLISYKPGIRIKLAFMFLFGAMLPLLLLIFTGIADRTEREKVLKENIRKQSIAELTKIDDGMLYEQKRIDHTIAVNIKKNSAIVDKNFHRAAKLVELIASGVAGPLSNFCLDCSGPLPPFLQGLADIKSVLKGLSANFSIFAGSLERAMIISESLSGIVAIPSGSKEVLFNMRQDDIFEQIRGFIIEGVKTIFNSMCGNDESKSVKGGLSVQNIGSFMTYSVILGCDAINSLTYFDTIIPAYLTFLFSSNHELEAMVMYLFSREALQKHYLFKVSKRHDRLNSLTDVRFAALPKVDMGTWPAFPKRITGKNQILREMANQVCKTSLPTHREDKIGGRKYLLTACQGKYLDGYVLFYAHPYRNIETKISSLNNRLIFLTALVILLACFSSFITSNMLMKPLNELTYGLGAFSEGNFRITLKSAPVDEFATMLGSLNRMLYNFHELKVAKTVQETLYPEGSLNIEGCELVGKSFAATELAGDYIDWFQLKDGRVLIVVGDVTGHGIAPAMIQASIKVWISLMADSAKAPADLLREVNRLHLKYGFKKLYMTCWLAFFNPADGRLDFASAGHPYPLMLRASNEHERLNTPGMPIGIKEKIRIGSDFRIMNEGDTLVLYTDGIVETPNKNGALMGYDNFERACYKCAGKSAGEVVESLLNYAYSWGEQNDDRTVVCLRRCEKGAKKQC